MKITISCEVTPQLSEAIKRLHQRGLCGDTMPETIEYLISRSVLAATAPAEFSSGVVTASDRVITVQRDVVRSDGKCVDIINMPAIGLVYEVPGGLSDHAINRLVTLFEMGFQKGHAHGIIDAQRNMKDALGLP
jgi:hypothetical protein